MNRNFGYEKNYDFSRQYPFKLMQTKQNKNPRKIFTRSFYSFMILFLLDQLDRWNELEEVLRVQTRAEFANILFDR
jgi:hypothetical protein